CSTAGVAFFARDSASTLPVWSASQGYPGDGSYREFHRDLGWDLPEDRLQELGIRSRRPLGLKLHRVTAQGCPLENKQPYDPMQAQTRLEQHATAYLQSRVEQLHGLTNAIERPPLLVSPFDAELFGHWWFEGPRFLGELFRQGPGLELQFTHLREHLAQGLPLQVCQPSPSSWGQGGYHDYWLNDSNAWVVPEWQRASRAMVRRVNRGVGSVEQRRLLTQAGRELLLAQSSDWSFILRAGTTTSLARERIHRHLDRFWRLMDAIENSTPLQPEWIQAVEREDGLFPTLNAADWTTRP
ncbi:MAG: 1,4-alpha-glucan branching protein domain-containing protein, partial [Cyanobium sp.]